MFWQPRGRLDRCSGIVRMLREKATGRWGSRARQMRSIRDRFYLALWTRAADDLGATLEQLGDGFLRLGRQGRSTCVRRSDVMLDSRLAFTIAGHKPLTTRLLLEAGHPAASGLEYTLASLGEAERWLDRLGRAAVVKPAVAGSAGRGITTGIVSARQLRRASLRAAAFGERLWVEEQVEGHSYRLLFLGSELLDAVRRDAPRVVGDGRRSIAQLIEAENAQRLAGHDDPRSLHVLRADADSREYLRFRGLTLQSVPADQEAVVVKRVVNQNSRFEQVGVRAEVHPTTIDTGRRVAALFGVQLAGIDIIAGDIGRPLADVGGVVGEINTAPGLHHHYLIRDPRRAAPVAHRIADYLLSATVAAC